MITPNWLLRGEYLYYSLESSPSVVAGSVTPLPPGRLGLFLGQHQRERGARCVELQVLKARG
jgi:hypothetical protein